MNLPNIEDTKFAIQQTLSKSSYRLLFGIVFIAMLVLYVAVPVFSIPGNSVLFQLNIFGIVDYVILSAISISVALMITLQVYHFKLKRSVKDIGQGFFGSYSGLMAGIFGSASCTSCVAALFGFLGIGAVTALVEYRNYIVIGALIAIFASIYYTSKGIQKKCEKC